MEFKLSESRLRELAHIETAAGCDIDAGGGWDHELAKTVVNAQQPQEPASSLSFEIYQDASGHYRWRCQSNTGKIVANSTEAHPTREDCESEIYWFQHHMLNALIMA